MRSAGLVMVDPEEMIHPYRNEMDEMEIVEVAQGVANNENWMSLDQIEALQDILYDHIVSKVQTHPGEIILQ